MKIIRIISLCLFTFLVGCNTTAPTPSEIFKGQSADKIFAEGEEDLAKGRYSSAVQHFEALDSLYPFDKHAEQALLDSIYAYYESGDEASAVAAADKYTHLYPRSEHSDYAYYMKGLANYDQDRNWFLRYLPVDWSERDLGTAKQAFNDFSQLIRFYPHSPYAADARQRMIYLRNILARSEINIAQFYLQKTAYVAAANRANYIVQHYEQTPVIPDALVIMIKSYRQLGLMDRANETLRILQLNYPNSSQLREVTSS